MKFEPNTHIPEDEIETLTCTECGEKLKFNYIYSTYIAECCETLYTCKRDENNSSMYYTNLIRSKI